MSISRRTFLGCLGTAGRSGDSGPVAQAAGTANLTGYPDSLGVAVRRHRCIGCRKCKRPAQGQRTACTPKALQRSAVLDASAGPTPRLTRSSPLREHPGRQGAPVSQAPVQPLPGAACASACSCALSPRTARRRDLRRIRMRRLPLLHDRLPLLKSPPTSTTRPSPSDYEVHLLSSRLIKGQLPLRGDLPAEALTFGKRRNLLMIARSASACFRAVIIDHIYGETEMGGTAWLTISGVPFRELGLREDLEQHRRPSTKGH